MAAHTQTHKRHQTKYFLVLSSVPMRYRLISHDKRRKCVHKKQTCGRQIGGIIHTHRHTYVVPSTPGPHMFIFVLLLCGKPLAKNASIRDTNNSTHTASRLTHNARNERGLKENKRIATILGLKCVRRVF